MAVSQSTESNNPWGERVLRPSAPASFDLGPLRLRVYRRGNDVLVHTGPVPSPTGTKPDSGGEQDSAVDRVEGDIPETGFRRYAFAAPVERILVSPRLPTRPLVARPREALTIAPGADTVFYVSVPLEYHLEAINPESGEATLLERMPLELLSDTWFGTPQMGHLAFSIKTRAQRDPSAYEGISEFGKAVVSLEFVNTASISLRFEKFSMHLEHCALYRSANRLWTSPIHVAYRGIDLLSEATYPPGAPAHLASPASVLPPEVPIGGNILKRTFGRVSASLFANI